MTSVACINCGRDYPAIGVPFRCPKCGGIYDYKTPIEYDPLHLEDSQPGIWKYRKSFSMMEETKPISLGEGNTPLIWTKEFGLDVGFKCEFINPTGSFKDRGSSLITSFLLSRKIHSCFEDSSGNAGSSLAAYTARAGINLSVYVPDSISENKRRQIEAYGAELIPVKGSRQDVHQTTKNMADSGGVYASHAYLPFNLPGYASISYEIFDQMNNTIPEAIILPVGQGGLLLGIYRGLKSMQLAGLINKIPALVGVQARRCAPLWSLFTGGIDGLRFATDNQTLAEGVRVWHPIRGDETLKTVGSTGGLFIAVDESEIIEGARELAGRGFYVENTSALVWNALLQCKDLFDGPIVMILTGSGLKGNSKLET